MASKLVHVKAHERLIKTRIYKFICEQCLMAVERETYAVKCPKYCADCRPPKPEKPVAVSHRAKLAEMIIKKLNNDDELTYTDTNNNENLGYAS